MINYFDYFIDHSSRNITPIKPFTINFYHLVIVLEGSCTYIVDGKSIKMEKNDALLLVPGTFRERPHTPNYIHIVILNFFAEESEMPLKNQFFKNAVNQTIRRLLDIYPYKSYIDLKKRKINTDIAKAHQVIKYIFECIFLELYDSLNFPTRNPHIINALKYINDNVSKPISLSDVAASAHLSNEYTSRLFKKEMGLTVSEYINTKKLNIAKNMLENENITLQSISASLGYENYTYFTKIFKERFCITPQKMRKEIKLKKESEYNI